MNPVPASRPLATRFPASDEALTRASSRWASRFGSASVAELERQALAALASEPQPALPAAQGPAAERLCCQLERAHEARFGRAALRAERDDDEARDRARASGTELARYEQTWERALARLQRAHPERWHVAGLSDDEVRDALTLHLIELVVAPPGGEPPLGRPGKRWGLCMARAQLHVLRRAFRLAAAPTDFDTLTPHDRAPNQEQAFLELEVGHCRSLAEQRAQHGLSRPQRRWLDAMKRAANAGEFFASSGQLNLSAASRELDKDRSSAQRAYRALQVRFQGEFEGLSSRRG